MANNDDPYDPREWELETPAPVHKPPPAFFEDPEFKRQMEFQDFINTPEGEKWVLDMMKRTKAEQLSDRYQGTAPPGPDVRNRADMTKHRNDVSRKVLADEEEKLAPKHSQPLPADTE
tara:strand:- start:3610 stop:3963 length:354 start_codon:yes stop_codon:yes gene_type:complete